MLFCVSFSPIFWISYHNKILLCVETLLLTKLIELFLLTKLKELCGTIITLYYLLQLKHIQCSLLSQTVKKSCFSWTAVDIIHFWSIYRLYSGSGKLSKLDFLFGNLY